MGIKEKGRNPKGFNFSIDARVHKRFSEMCRSRGHNPSRIVENFMRGEVESNALSEGLKKESEK